jgi:TetR/AcrR family transcriptional regulator, regulator of cefoperazone and chloramphenicol sensitivity
MVADAAGVSVGLVQHYFRAKGELIEAVDEHMLTFIADEMNSSPLPESPADPLLEAGSRLTSMIAKRPEVLEYAGRCLVEGEAMGPVIFDGLLHVSVLQRDEFAKQQLTRDDLDPLWAAMNPLILRVGAIILRHHIERHLPEPFTTPTQLQRWDAAVTTLIREGQLRRNPPSSSRDANGTS